MVKKDVSDLKIKNIQRISVKGKIYILEKKQKRPTLSYQVKKIKRHRNGWSKEKKNTVRAAMQKVLNTK